ncbi:unnamed protein product [Prorocentrum cordatum]|uniref:Ubiquitinyl hydrolase 1 n=1 Tax=Prorocentrum cordatum TaxID=2364126 RepID=A0ABN9RSQ7_9DINO|nr:unnamed protein product [Polarella glacialis]
MAENAATFVAITGAPLEQAEMYLEMAGGDMEQAVAIFFANQDVPMGAADGGAAPPAEEAAAGAVASQPAPAWWHVIWPAVEEPPEAWTRQRLDCGDGWPGGIPQPKNGPCGVLAVVHGFMLAGQHAKEAADIQVSAQAAAEAIAGILARCRPEEGAPIRLARPRERGNYRPDVELEEAGVLRHGGGSSRDPGPRGRLPRAWWLDRPGDSAVMTRGIEQVRIDATAEGGELPLVIRQFNCWLCTTELLSLLMRGRAEDRQRRAVQGRRQAERVLGGRLGGHPLQERERERRAGRRCPQEPSGPSLDPARRRPLHPWAKAMPAAEPGSKFVLNHWNGLPPGGPRLAEIGVAAVRGAVASGAKEAPKFYKPVPGEVDDLVQADPDDKKAFPDKYRQWRYEVLLAWDDPSVQGEPRPPDAKPEPTFDQDRGRGAGAVAVPLVLREALPDNGLRPGARRFSRVVPEVPEDSQGECGWSLWMPWSDLPSRFQEQPLWTATRPSLRRLFGPSGPLLRWKLLLVAYQIADMECARSWERSLGTAAILH